ncbi:MAG TPA: MinD/ParA family protein [Bacillota bacterium]|nr:MinD/ParA family protein [Bacillota bacterium]
MNHDQAKYLRQSLKQKLNDHKGHTIAIVSGKGGVGKSNIAVNFTLELINQQKSVLLIDLDVGMGNIDILLGLSAKYTIIDMIKQRMPIDTIVERGPNNISYIAGGNTLEQLFALSNDDANYFLKQYENIQRYYDYIIFDLGAGASQDSLFFILASDECFVVTTPEPTSITDAYGMIKHILTLDQTIPIYLIMNRMTSKKQGEQTMKRFQNVVKQFLNYEVQALGYLPYDPKVTDAVMKQTPLLMNRKRSSMARGIRQMTHHFLTKKRTDNHNNKLSFIDKFKLLLTKR